MATQRTTKRPSRSTIAVLNDNGIDASSDLDVAKDDSQTTPIDQERAQVENEKVEGLNPVMESETARAAKDRF